MTAMLTSPPEMAATLLERDGWSRERMLAFQRERLDGLLRHAVERSPYYRETLGEAPWGRPLEELPILTKPELMSRWDDVATVPGLRLADAEAQLAAPGYDGTLRAGLHACATSGTTGRRGVFVCSAEELSVWIAATLRAFARIGIGPDTQLCAIGSPNPAHMSHQLFSRLRPGAPAPPVSVLSDVADIAAYARRVRPEALAGYPTVCAALADEQLRGRIDIAPRIVAVASEVLTEDAADRIRAAWGVEPRQAYPTTEAPMIGSAPASSTDLLISEDLVIVEVVDEDGAPVPPGTPGHRVLLTNLVNRVQPLIRYELPDVVTWAEPAGSPQRRITRIQGRTSELVALPRVAGGEPVRVHAHRLLSAFAGLPGVTGYQLRVRPGRLTARIVPDGGGEVLDAVRAALAAAVAELGATAEIGVVPADCIERAGTGKLATVVVEA